MPEQNIGPRGRGTGPFQEEATGRRVKADRGLTICVATRDRRPELPRLLSNALDCLEQLERDGFAAELLIVDGGSRDGSRKLLRSAQAVYEEARLNVLEARTEECPAILQNLGLRAATYRYVCVTDPGIELVPENLGLLLRGIEDTGEAMAYGNVLLTSGAEVEDVLSNMPATPRLTQSNYLDPCCIVDAPRLLRLGRYYELSPNNSGGREMALHLISEEETPIFVPVTMGYRHEDQPAEDSGPVIGSVLADPRYRGRARVGRIYHPDAGFLDE